MTQLETYRRELEAEQAALLSLARADEARATGVVAQLAMILERLQAIALIQRKER